MTREQLLQDMHQCHQTKSQSVYDHGLKVWEHTQKATQYLDGGLAPLGWRMPGWLLKHREELRAALLPLSVIEEYTVFHDCGKPYCKPDGERRFPDHAEVSYRTWLSVGGSDAAAKLMRLDMKAHTMRAEEVEAFAALPEAATLLIVALAEVHANATMFGGIESTSFKMKWKHLDRRGRAVCKAMFPPLDKLYLITRNDLSDGQQAVQASHASHEFGDSFPEEYRAWRENSNTLALLATENEDTLNVLFEEARKKDISVAPFYEQDRGDELTAIAISPEGKRLCRGLGLALG